MNLKKLAAIADACGEIFGGRVRTDRFRETGKIRDDLGFSRKNMPARDRMAQQLFIMYLRKRWTLKQIAKHFNLYTHSTIAERCDEWEKFPQWLKLEAYRRLDRAVEEIEKREERFSQLILEPNADGQLSATSGSLPLESGISKTDDSRVGACASYDSNDSSPNVSTAAE